MNRRDFFTPRQLAGSLGQIAGALQNLNLNLNHLEVTPPRREVLVTRVSRRAMATVFEVLLPFGTAQALAAGEDALDLIDRLEDQLTVYRESSELSRINTRANLAPVPVEEELFGLLQRCAELHAVTEGAFDVSVGALIKTWGFFRRCGQVPSPQERATALGRIGMGFVELDPDARTVRLLQPGVELNLGSIGKGYALDRAAGLLRWTWDIPAALLHGGHSSVYAIGSEPGEDKGWRVGITHPWEPTRRIAIVCLRDRGLGTSAATFQHFAHENRVLGHILDPRLGWPAQGVASSTVLAPTAAEADALATAFFILGVEKARAYCRTHPDVAAVILPDDAAEPVVLGLARDQYELA